MNQFTGETVEEAREFLRLNRVEGTKCPCCYQRVALNPCSITTTMALGLLNLFKLTRDNNEPVHVKDLNISSSGGAFAQLSKWGLIASYVNHDKTKRTSGFWYITQKGEQFVTGQIKVPKKAYIYNNEVKAWDNITVDFKEAIKNNFDYSEVIGESKQAELL
jgi:hypothetical protein